MAEYFFTMCDLYFRLISPIELRFDEPMEEYLLSEEEFYRRVCADDRNKEFYGTELPHEEWYEQYEIQTYPGLLPDAGPCLSDKRIYWIYKDGERYVYRYRVGRDFNPYHSQLTLDLKTHRHIFLVPEQYLEPVCQYFRISKVLGIEPLALNTHRIIMHAACVRMNGQMVLFTGPSGMGKSTQSNLWIRHIGADPVDGDKTILYYDEAVDASFYAYGSLYAGSSGIAHNISAPVKAIISLGQGPDNVIRRLRPAEAYRKLYPRFLVPQWDSQLVAAGMERIQELIMNVPVYELVCTPDERAVDLAYQTIFGEVK